MAYRRIILTTGHQDMIKDDLTSLFDRVKPDFPDVKTKIVSGIKADTLVVDLNGDGADALARKVNDIGKKHKAVVKIKKERPLALKEDRISFPQKTARALYKIVQKYNDALVFANGVEYAFDINDLKADIDSTDTVYGITKDGSEKLIKLADIEFITVFPKNTQKHLKNEDVKSTELLNSKNRMNSFGVKKTNDGVEFYTDNGNHFLGRLLKGDYYIADIPTIRECGFLVGALKLLHIPCKREDVIGGTYNLVFSHAALVKLLLIIKDAFSKNVNESKGASDRKYEIDLVKSFKRGLPDFAAFREKVKADHVGMEDKQIQILYNRIKDKYFQTEGVYGYDDDFDEGPQPGDAEYHTPKQTKQIGMGKFKDIDWKVIYDIISTCTIEYNRTGKRDFSTQTATSDIVDDRDGLLNHEEWNWLQDNEFVYDHHNYPLIENDKYMKGFHYWYRDIEKKWPLKEGTDTTPSPVISKPVLSREKTFANVWAALLYTNLRKIDDPFGDWERKLGTTDEIGISNAKLLRRDLEAIYTIEKGPRFKQIAYNKIIKILHGEKIA